MTLMLQFYDTKNQDNPMQTPSHNYYTDRQYMRYVRKKIVSVALQDMIDTCYEQLQLLKKESK